MPTAGMNPRQQRRRSQGGPLDPRDITTSRGESPGTHGPGHSTANWERRQA